MRLLLCLECRSIEELPDYDGPMVYNVEVGKEVPAEDNLLEHLVDPHRRQQHNGQLIQVDDAHWADREIRAKIIEQIREGTGGKGLGDEAYAVRNTFSEGALECYRAHGRPKDGCIDYKDRSKVLGNALLTREERKEAKKAGLKREKLRFLCEWCPVHTAYVQPKIFDKQGLYQ